MPGENEMNKITSIVEEMVGVVVMDEEQPVMHSSERVVAVSESLLERAQDKSYQHIAVENKVQS